MVERLGIIAELIDRKKVATLKARILKVMDGGGITFNSLATIEGFNASENTLGQDIHFPGLKNVLIWRGTSIEGYIAVAELLEEEKIDLDTFTGLGQEIIDDNSGIIGLPVVPFDMDCETLHWLPMIIWPGLNNAERLDRIRKIDEERGIRNKQSK